MGKKRGQMKPDLWNFAAVNFLILRSLHYQQFFVLQHRDQMKYR